jgi:hypothetical protein
MNAKLTPNQMLAELARLQAENEALKASTSKPVTIKVSGKGAVSVYGLGRFPVTLYKTQWFKLLDAAPAVQAFIKANESKLATKDSPRPAIAAPGSLPGDEAL